MTRLNFPKPSCAGTKLFRGSVVYPNNLPSAIFVKCFLCCYMGWFPSDDNRLPSLITSDNDKGTGILQLIPISARRLNTNNRT